MAVIKDEIQLHLEGGTRAGVEAALMQGELGANVGAEDELIYRRKDGSGFLHPVTQERMTADPSTILGLLGGPFIASAGSLAGAYPRGTFLTAAGALSAQANRVVLTTGSLAATVAAIGGTSVRLVLAASFTLAANLTIPANIQLEHQPGCPIALAGFTLTLNSEPIAGLFQIFSGSGTVTFSASSNRGIPPQWWGAKGDGVTDDYTALAAWIAACPIGGLLKLPYGRYRHTQTLAWGSKKMTVEGYGFGSCLFPDTGSGVDGHTFGNTATGVHLFNMRNLAIIGNGTCRDTVVMQGVFRSRFENIHVNGGTRYEVYMRACLGNFFNFIISHNFAYPYPSGNTFDNTGGFIRIGPKLVVGGGNTATNGNIFDCTLEGGEYVAGTSAQFFQETQSGEGNNWIHGIFQGSVTQLTLTFAASGYINCVAGDVGKAVVQGGVSGTLTSFDNTARQWVVRTSSQFVVGNAVTITAGTGAGTTSAVGTATRAIEIYGSVMCHISDWHGEAAGNVLLSGCRACTVGAGVRVEALYITNSVNTKIDGVEIGELNIDVDSKFTHLGSISFNAVGGTGILSDLSASSSMVGGMQQSLNGNKSEVTGVPSGIKNLLWNGDLRRFTATPAPDGFTFVGSTPTYEQCGIGKSDTTRLQSAYACKVTTGAINSGPSWSLTYVGDSNTDRVGGKWITVTCYVKLISGPSVVTLRIRNSVGSVVASTSTSATANFAKLQLCILCDDATATSLNADLFADLIGSFYMSDWSITQGFGAPQSIAPSPSNAGEFLLIDGKKVSMTTGSPTLGSGVAVAGDIKFERSPVSQGATMWQCTAGGNPGSWDSIVLGTMPVSQGGTGSSNATGARTNLGLGISDTVTHNIIRAATSLAVGKSTGPTRTVDIHSAAADACLRVNCADTTKYPTIELTHGDSTSDNWQWYKTPTKNSLVFWRGAEFGFVGRIFAMSAEQSFSNLSSLNSITSVGGEGSMTLPANFFSYIGKSVRFKVKGKVSNTGTPTALWQLAFGATTIVDSGAVAMATVSNVGYDLEIQLTCRSVGASGTVIAMMTWRYGAGNFVDTIGVPVTIDTTSAQAMTLKFQWGAASASNAIFFQTLIAETIN